MSDTDDVRAEEYYNDMAQGYYDALEEVALSKNMGELSINLEKLEQYTNEYGMTRADSHLKGLSESAKAFETIQDIVKQAKPTKRKLILSAIGGFIGGLIVNYVSFALFGG